MIKPFQLRNAQIRHFDRLALDALIDKVIGHLRERHAADIAGLSDARLRARVERGIDRARGHGLTWEYSLFVFVGLMFTVGPDFDQYPPIRACLEDPAYPPDERVDTMLAAITPQQWHGAHLRADERAWHDDA
jgi:hypothetical protein